MAQYEYTGTGKTSCARGLGERMGAGEVASRIVRGRCQVVMRLRVHPELRRGFQEFCQTQGGIRRDLASAFDDLLDVPVVNPDLPRPRAGANIRFIQEFAFQDAARLRKMRFFGKDKPMAQYQHLPIYKQTYDVLLRTMVATKDFPREYKYTLGQKIKDELIELVVMIYRANSAADKALHIQAILERVQAIQLMMRLSHDMKILSRRHYAALSEMTDSLARQAQGWLKGTTPGSERRMTERASDSRA